jgi:trimethylamine--corrinoid protein Co-methyltransferase
MLGVLRAAATAGEGCVVASFQMLGASGPASVLGALSQGVAEALFGTALTQLHNPGAPVVFGIYAMPFDMRAMVPRFGDPISPFVQSGSVQLARRFRLPALAYGGLTSSKIDDAQAGAEAAMGLRTAIDVGADFVLHATGWLENGRTTGFAKFRREALVLEHEAARCG